MRLGLAPRPHIAGGSQECARQARGHGGLLTTVLSKGAHWKVAGPAAALLSQ